MKPPAGTRGFFTGCRVFCHGPLGRHYTGIGRRDLQMGKMNNNNRPAESSGSMTLGDVYFVVFRHKWKIILFALAGLVAAATFYFLNPPLYQSEAELFIRYITDS